MSVLVIAKISGDTGKVREALAARAGEFAAIADRAKGEGAISHRFGVGDGYVMIVDEWESPEHFEKFFGNPELQAFVASVGAAPAPPEVTVSEAVTSSDQF
jgi:quinol monooxygenase YgiN